MRECLPRTAFLRPERERFAAIVTELAWIASQAVPWEQAGVRPRAAGLEEGDREDLALLAALWETGRLERWGPEFT